ncbi:hypothetical protein [Microbacterium sp. NPDC056569]|uniref:hypothetical protein n=1 Tax=Microbacterium sp. NPDC056569 TaxID=3345867 RepID=UPI003670365D
MIAALTACTTSSSGSRATLYESLDALAADSSVIVVGTVTEQRGDPATEQHGGPETTVSSVDVTNVPANPQLAANLDATHATVAVGDVVEVRQDTGPVLTLGEEYMLFLTPSMLSGDAASDYFITGAVAGLYERDGDEFRRVALDSGDTLPETIAIAGD